MAFEHADGGRHAAEAFGGVLGDGPHDEVADLRGQVLDAAVQRNGVDVQDLAERLMVVGAFERPMAGEQLIGHHPQAKMSTL